MGRFENELLEWRAEGRDLPEAYQRVLTYSDAEARVSVKLSLKNDGIDGKAGRRSYNDFQVDLDLLRPVRSPGDGQCTSFPMPCPWDVKIDEWVAVAVEVQPFGRVDTTYCIRIDHPNLAQSDRIRLLRETAPADEVIWPFIEAEWPELFGLDANPGMVMRTSPRPRPAPNHP
jgi:hypothetical protein